MGSGLGYPMYSGTRKSWGINALGTLVVEVRVRVRVRVKVKVRVRVRVRVGARARAMIRVRVRVRGMRGGESHVTTQSRAAVKP